MPGEQASISPQHLCLSLFPPARWVLQKCRLIRRETRPGVHGCVAKAEPRGGDKKLAGERVTHLRAAAGLGPRPCAGGPSRKQTHPLEKASDGAWGEEATQEPTAPCPLHASSSSGPQRSLGPGGCGPEAVGQLQNWTPLLHCWEHLLSKHASSTTGAQASSQLGKDTVPSGYLPGSGLLARKEGKVTVFIRTQEGRTPSVLHTHLERHLSAQWTPFLGGVRTL